jgi:hypothetical protein
LDCYRAFKAQISEHFVDISNEQYAFVRVDVDSEQLMRDPAD